MSSVSIPLLFLDLLFFIYSSMFFCWVFNSSKKRFSPALSVGNKKADPPIFESIILEKKVLR